MKHLFSILLLILFQFNINSQDIDIYKKDKNDNYKMPEVSQKMTFDEFNLLSKNVRMKDMLYASIVPGYIHFKAKENTVGYWVLGVRIASYITIGTVYYDAKGKLFAKDNLLLSEEEKKEKNKLQNIFYSALTVAVSSYLFDLIQGDAILNKKQEKVRFKYSLKIDKQTSLTPTKNKGFYPSLAITYKF